MNSIYANLKRAAELAEEVNRDPNSYRPRAVQESTMYSNLAMAQIEWNRTRNLRMPQFALMSMDEMIETRE